MPGLSETASYVYSICSDDADLADPVAVFVEEMPERIDSLLTWKN